MDFTSIVLVICVFSCSGINSIHGQFRRRPRNQYSIVGDNPILPELNCLADPAGKLTWWDPKSGTQIAFRHDVAAAFDHQFEITGNDTAFEANLKFKHMDISYGGDWYRCMNFDATEGFSVLATVIVIDGPYNCSSNANLDDLVEGEEFSIVCELRYSAAWEPTMVWRDNLGNEIQPDDATDGVKFNRMTRTITRKAQIHDTTRSFRCQMEFGAPKPEEIPDLEPTLEYSRDSPGYVKNYQTVAMDVKYTPKNMLISPNRDPKEYYPGETVSCSAKGNPAPEMKWVDLDNNTKSIGRSAVDLLITKEMEGIRLFKCSATNEIRGTSSEISMLFNFTVTIPTTTTTTTTTPAPTTAADPDPPPAGQGLQPRGLSAGILAAIIIAVIVVLILLVLILFCLIRRCRKAPSKEKEKQKPRLDGVDQVRRPTMNGPPGKPPHLNYNQKPPLDDDIYKPQASPNAYDKAPPKWGEPVEPMYDVALDDTPRSRKPIQVYDTLDYTDFQRV